MSNVNRIVRRSLVPTLGFGAAIALVTFLAAPPPHKALAATPGTMTYTYDSLGRVITDANASGNSGAYNYDNAGNRIAATSN